MKIPKITAAVAFSGSASNMEVGTSLVCPRTGNLMVESHVASTLPRLSPHLQPLLARWNHNGEGAEVSSLQVADCNQPHVSIPVSRQDPRLPAMPVSQSNRDSNIVQKLPKSLHSVQLSDLSTNLEEEENSLGEDDQGQSIIWSQSGAAMPEIIELNINLRVDADYKNDFISQKQGSDLSQETVSLLDSSYSWEDESQDESSDFIYEIGIAYLVLFGNDGGTTLMDLPVKKLKKTFPENIVVERNASIRVRVDVYPKGKEKRMEPKALQVFSQEYQLYDANMLEPILHQLKKAEEMRLSREQDRTNVEKMSGASGVLCGVIEMFVSGCNDDGGGYAMNRSWTMDSTIDTAPSMRSSIW